MLMLKTLQRDETPPTFSGHGTFPMRYGWLKKSFDAVDSNGSVREVFTNDEAIARFGVGKNMVSSMRHWCNVTNVFDKDTTSGFAKKVFADDGLDPYLESPITLWLLHYSLATNPQLLTYYWFFNVNNSLNLDRRTLQQEVEKYCRDNDYHVPSSTTLKRDVECIVRLYMYRSEHNNDDAIDSPLAELGLIVPIHKQGYFSGNRGAKATLIPALFWAAVFQFWEHSHGDASAVSLDALAYNPLGPGRIFLLDENSIVDYIYQSLNMFEDKVSWSETAGKRQLVLRGEVKSTLDELIEKSDALIIKAYQDEVK